jgi:hypothetical protein
LLCQSVPVRAGAQLRCPSSVLDAPTPGKRSLQAQSIFSVGLSICRCIYVHPRSTAIVCLQGNAGPKRHDADGDAYCSCRAATDAQSMQQ